MTPRATAVQSRPKKVSSQVSIGNSLCPPVDKTRPNRAGSMLAAWDGAATCAACCCATAASAASQTILITAHSAARLLLQVASCSVEGLQNPAALRLSAMDEVTVCKLPLKASCMVLLNNMPFWEGFSPEQALETAPAAWTSMLARQTSPRKHLGTFDRLNLLIQRSWVQSGRNLILDWSTLDLHFCGMHDDISMADMGEL